ncbi:MAG: hypothetical protein ACRCXZ_07415, partial [Patescibacteria group bacterium]
LYPNISVTQEQFEQAGREALFLFDRDELENGAEKVVVSCFNSPKFKEGVKETLLNEKRKLKPEDFQKKYNSEYDTLIQKQASEMVSVFITANDKNCKKLSDLKNSVYVSSQILDNYHSDFVRCSEEVKDAKGEVAGKKSHEIIFNKDENTFVGVRINNPEKYESKVLLIKKP